MWFKKKVKEVEEIDERFLDMWAEMLNLQDYLEEGVQKVQEVLRAVELYPEGADKEAEKKLVIERQQSLLGRVAYYDDKRQQLFDYMRQRNGAMGWNWPHYETGGHTYYAINVPSSHEVIRKAASKA